MRSKQLLMGAAALGLAAATFLAGAYLARAKSGGESRRSLSFAGRITGVTGPQSLTFKFKKGGASQCEPVVSATPDGTGAFNVEIPLSSCPGALFDGGDVTFDVSVGATVIASDQVVNPVPYARYADQVGSPECPVGYSRDPSIASITMCARSGDELVKVGTGPSAFWIDRYEASVWSAADGTGTQFGTLATPDYPATFPPNGQYSTPTFAVSRAGVQPSRNITWFQASEACAAGGKRLATSGEWLRAARGTPDPTADSDGAAGTCVTKAVGPRASGGGSSCLSAWGAQDMVGNVGEWVDEWWGSLGNADYSATPWPAGYGNDGTFNITSKAFIGGSAVQGAPATLVRGGNHTDGVVAGVNSMVLYLAPTASVVYVGFRCVTPR